MAAVFVVINEDW